MRPLTDEEVKRHGESIQTDGYAVMKDAIDENSRAAIGEELARLAKVRPGGDIPPAPFSGFHTRRWFDLLNDGDVSQHPPLSRAEPLRGVIYGAGDASSAKTIRINGIWAITQTPIARPVVTSSACRTAITHAKTPRTVTASASSGASGPSGITPRM